MHIANGLAQVRVKIQCEKIVPVRGSADIFKRSSVVITRIVEVDLTVTEDRRQLYQRIMELRQEQSGRLSNNDTFDLYKTFMALAKASNAGGEGDDGTVQQVRIDEQVDEERILGLRDLQLVDGSLDDRMKMRSAFRL